MMAALFTAHDGTDESLCVSASLTDCLCLSFSLSSKYCQQPGVDPEQIHPGAQTGETRSVFQCGFHFLFFFGDLLQSNLIDGGTKRLCCNSV